MTVALEQPALLNLGQATQALGLQQLHGPMEFGEVLLDHGVGKLGELSGPELLDHRSQLAHEPSSSNMCSTIKQVRLACL